MNRNGPRERVEMGARALRQSRCGPITPFHSPSSRTRAKKTVSFLTMGRVIGSPRSARLTRLAFREAKEAFLSRGSPFGYAKEARQFLSGPPG